MVMTTWPSPPPWACRRSSTTCSGRSLRAQPVKSRRCCTDAAPGHHSRCAVAVAIDEESGDLVAFVDVDGATSTAPPDGLFTPRRRLPLKADRLPGGPLPSAGGPEAGDLDGDLGIDSVDGFVNPPPIPAHLAYSASTAPLLTMARSVSRMSAATP